MMTRDVAGRGFLAFLVGSCVVVVDDDNFLIVLQPTYREA